ncbi:MAG: hypothetical protein KatS3mg110_3672 [Pirellulaceae bacterium]|nr:MAG: hypothetical protein KatS3mg110_3672 [Pirellulaceae bacterium]
MGRCRHRRYRCNWLPYGAVMVALWQGPIPIVHQHDVGPDDLGRRPFLWEHFVRYHGSLLEQMQGDPKRRLVSPSHLHVGWHWHFVLPGFPDEDGCPESLTQYPAGKLLLPVAPFTVSCGNLVVLP